LGREFSTEPDYSDEIAREIDDEVRRIIEGAHQRARSILTEHRGHLDSISGILVRRETIEKNQFEGLLAGQAEADVFGPEDTPRAQLPPAPTATPAPDRPREAPRPLPRPGLAGGTAELRTTDPEQPELT
ncbi:MAG: ATP-dependent zinc metalloprotease FtsH, partial [Solirubrobacteraceae bacterium]